MVRKGNVKRLLAVILSAAMVFQPAAATFAAEETIEVNNGFSEDVVGEDAVADNDETEDEGSEEPGDNTEEGEESAISFSEDTDAVTKKYEDITEKENWSNVPEAADVVANKYESDLDSKKLTVTGDLPYTEFKEFDEDSNLQSGNYLAVLLSKELGTDETEVSEDASIEVDGENIYLSDFEVVKSATGEEGEENTGGEGDTATTVEALMILRVNPDKSQQEYTLKVDWDGDSGEVYKTTKYTLDLSSLELGEKPDDRTLVEITLDQPVTPLNGNNAIEVLKQSVHVEVADPEEPGDEGEGPEEGNEDNGTDTESLESRDGDEGSGDDEDESTDSGNDDKEDSNGNDVTKEVLDALSFIWFTSEDSEEKADVPTETGEYSVLARLDKDHEKYRAEADSNTITVDLTVDDEPPVDIPKDDGIEITFDYGDGENVTSLNGTSKEIEDTVKGWVKVTSWLDGKEYPITDEVKGSLSLKWVDKDGNPSSETPKISGVYDVIAVLEESDDYPEAESEPLTVNLTITGDEDRTIVTIEANDIVTKYNGEAVVPELAGAKAYVDGLERDDIVLIYTWKDLNKEVIKAPIEVGEYELEITPEDTGKYEGTKTVKVTIEAEAVPDKDGKIPVEFSLLGADDHNKVTTTYNGVAYDAKLSVNNSEFDMKDAEIKWTKGEEKIDIDAEDVVNVGEYTLAVSIPASNEKYKGSATFTIVLTKRAVDVCIELNETETIVGSMVDYKVVPVVDEADGEFKGEFKWIQEPAVKFVKGDINGKDNADGYTIIAYGGYAGENYELKYEESEKVTFRTDHKKPLITDTDVTVTTPDKKLVYSGEPIEPAIKVAYLNPNTNKTQKLKLNIDYIVSYRNNVNAGLKTDDTAPTVIVQGIGEYAGYVETPFNIEQKSFKKVVLNPVGNVKVGETPIIIVTDGIYELNPNDYEAEYDTSKEGPAKLTIKGTHNYKSDVPKTADFTVLSKDADPGKQIVESMVSPKKDKKYTYNGKAQKPAVIVKGSDGKKLSSKSYKVIYKNNVDASVGDIKAKAIVVGKGEYYGNAEYEFTIAPKDFAKVKASNIKLPKTSDLNGLTLSVKDGKRVLVQGKDFVVKGLETKKALNGELDKLIKGNVKSTKFTLVATNSNYTDTSEKTVKVSLVAMNLASKTANVTVTSLNGTAAWADVKESDVKVIYNGRELVKAEGKTGTGDYYVSNIKNPAKSIKITATKNSAYKGSRTFKAPYTN